MPDILSRRHRAVLERFANANVLLAFDYDGTLAPIARDPDRARLRTQTRRLLTRVANCYPCVVISGRSVADLRARLNDIPLWHVSGNHGAEPWANDTRQRDRVRRWVAHLETQLASLPGVAVEDKGYSVAVHYRRAQNKTQAVRAIRRAVRDLRGLRQLGGKQAVNLIPDDAPDKGIALEYARRFAACDCAIYVGDDETDEDAFGSAPADRLLSSRIGGRQRSSAAGFHVRSQRQIDALLTALVRLRAPRRSLLRRRA
jgi:trehalose 6-phosphate phosphatase